MVNYIKIFKYLKYSNYMAKEEIIELYRSILFKLLEVTKSLNKYKKLQEVKIKAMEEKTNFLLKEAEKNRLTKIVCEGLESKLSMKTKTESEDADNRSLSEITEDLRKIRNDTASSDDLNRKSCPRMTGRKRKDSLFE